jgi:hypothetical protein
MRCTSLPLRLPDAESSGAHRPASHAPRVSVANFPVALSSTVMRTRPVGPPMPTTTMPGRPPAGSRPSDAGDRSAASATLAM